MKTFWSLDTKYMWILYAFLHTIHFKFSIIKRGLLQIKDQNSSSVYKWSWTEVVQNTFTVLYNRPSKAMLARALACRIKGQLRHAHLPQPPSDTSLGSANRCWEAVTTAQQPESLTPRLTPGCDLVHCGYLESKLVVESPQQKTRTLFWFLKKLYKNRKISYLYCRRLRFLCLLLFTGNSLRISNSLGEPQLHLAHNHIEQVLMNMYVNILVITKHTWARNVNFTLSYSISRI